MSATSASLQRARPVFYATSVRLIPRYVFIAADKLSPDVLASSGQSDFSKIADYLNEPTYLQEGERVYLQVGETVDEAMTLYDQGELADEWLVVKCVIPRHFVSNQRHSLLDLGQGVQTTKARVLNQTTTILPCDIASLTPFYHPEQAQENPHVVVSSTRHFIEALLDCRGTLQAHKLSARQMLSHFKIGPSEAVQIQAIESLIQLAQGVSDVSLPPEQKAALRDPISKLHRCLSGYFEQIDSWVPQTYLTPEINGIRYHKLSEFMTMIESDFSCSHRS